MTPISSDALPDVLPTPGRIVIYRSETGRYDYAALVVGTQGNVDPVVRADALDAILHAHAGDSGPDPAHVPEIVQHPSYCHLRVFPAGPGPLIYEPNVPYDATGDRPCSWRWPERVPV